MNGFEEYYAKRAHQYEQIYEKPERQADLYALKQKVAKLTARHRVLEIACGTGYWTQEIASGAARVVATDIGKEVLDLARRKYFPPRRVHFVRANAFRTPVKRNYFTVAVAGFWWSHIALAELRSFLESLHRCLAPHARVIFFDNRYVEGSSTPISREDDAGNTFQTRNVETGGRYELLKNFPSEQDIKQTITGLSTDVSYEESRYYWLLTYRCS